MSRCGEGRAAWLLVGLGLALWALADVWWTLQDGDVPTPSLGGVPTSALRPLSVGIVLLSGSGDRGRGFSPSTA